MAGVLDKTWYNLGPTLTHARREIEWIPGPDEHEGHAIITQSVREFRGHRAKLDRELYAVQEEPDGACGQMGRSFLWLNVSDKGQDDVYMVVIGPGLPTCTCKAAKCRVPGYQDFSGCKHRDATRKLIDEGEL